jgi:endogenous inhibitor of DNA gyrase (YacG/DUF329 family)
MLRCPICRKPAEPRPKNRWFPFCSERCKLIDLGKWMNGDYRIPGRPEENEDGTPPTSSNDGQAS